ncbi:unnamed protein product [Spirodela intermedia]|uniref:Uncharacterized protein n=1 Tax=Spirodela intermedia TaxID=51605 RepID=A0A7I8JI12_SPIIN|nr:unnamed protein product [Spirodela intermedia]CAA6669797.1 unnamed protein product [Spirodela intermedia]
MPAAAAETPSPLRHIHVESIQSVTPREMVPPGRHGGSAVPLPSGATSGRCSTTGGPTRVPLPALVVDPLIAGRIRRRDDGDGGGLEVRLNDAGLRLVQAKADFTMTELLASPEREVVEAHLAHWVGVDEEKPQFSALFFIQVTGFLDDGISIGLCCSLFLADPLLLSNFLHKWAQIHATMHAQKQFVSAGIFNLGHLGGQVEASILSPRPSPPAAAHRPLRRRRCHQRRRLRGGGAEGRGEAGRGCAGGILADYHGGRSHGRAQGGGVLREGRGGGAAALGGVSKGFSNFAGDWLRGGELGLTKGNKPVMVSWHLVPATDRPLVVVMPAVDGGGRAMVSVTFPKKEE